MDRETLPEFAAQDFASDAATLAIKAATRDLVDLAGGNARAGRKVGRGTSTVQRWGSTAPDDLDHLIPIRAALILEADTSQPLITQAMAELNGRSLGPGQAERQRNVFAAHGAMAKAVAAYHASFAEAIEDGQLSPNELNALSEHAGEISRAGARMQVVSASEAGAAVKLGAGG